MCIDKLFFSITYLFHFTQLSENIYMKYFQIFIITFTFLIEKNSDKELIIKKFFLNIIYFKFIEKSRIIFIFTNLVFFAFCDTEKLFSKLIFTTIFAASIRYRKVLNSRTLEPIFKN